MARTTKYAYDGTTIELSPRGLGDYDGIDSVSYGSTLDTQKFVGTGGKAKVFSPGVLTYDDASIEIWQDQWIDIMKKAGSREALHRLVFDVAIKYRLPGEVQPLIVEKLIDCKLKQAVANHTVGASDKPTCTVTFQVLDMSFEGG